MVFSTQVGLLTEDPNIVLEEGAQIVSELNQKPVEMIGHLLYGRS